MNKKKIIYTLTTSLVLGLASCTSEDFWDTFDRTADGPIDFTVGVESSPAQRSLTRAGAPDYYAMQGETQIRLKVDGKWAGKPIVDISQIATCKANTSTSKINSLTYDAGQTLYWDDYGVGDPANSENKTKGLTVYGVAVDGKTEAPTPDNGKWNALAWSTVDDYGNAEVNSSNHLLTKDILVSNNLTGYKFVDRNTSSASLLEFKHVLSKVTINITANNGFTTTGKVGKTTNKFESDPILTLTNAETVEAANSGNGAYALTEGTIDIEKAEANANDTKKNVIAVTTNAENDIVTVVKEVLVYPGTQLGASSGADTKVIAQLNVDGNIYYIKAAEISKAMLADDSQTKYMTKAGKNYVINILVNKTDINVSATVSSWENVTAQQADPKININEVYGANNNAKFEKTFNIYRSSTGLDNGYNEKSTISYSNASWTMNPQLYWPDHKTHFQFRGVWPKTTTDENVTNAPRIVSATHESKEYQVINVSNVAYEAESFPSDLMIARPEIDADVECTNTEVGHIKTKLYDGGICATEGLITLNFRYMMSQVEVNLSTVDQSNGNYVNLTGAKVELVGIYNGADVTLGSREVIPTGATDNYTLDVDANDANKRLSAIVPQDLKNVRFRITIINGTDDTDVYYADVASIKEKNSDSIIAKWESGKHYVYNLNITKTKINATATLKGWETVTAEQDVWF